MGICNYRTHIESEIIENVIWELHKGRMLFEESGKEQGLNKDERFTLAPSLFFFWLLLEKFIHIVDYNTFWRPTEKQHSDHNLPFLFMYIDIHESSIFILRFYI